MNKNYEISIEDSKFQIVPILFINSEIVDLIEISKRGKTNSQIIICEVNFQSFLFARFYNPDGSHHWTLCTIWQSDCVTKTHISKILVEYFMEFCKIQSWISFFSCIVFLCICLYLLQFNNVSFLIRWNCINRHVVHGFPVLFYKKRFLLLEIVSSRNYFFFRVNFPSIYLQ